MTAYVAVGRASAPAVVDDDEVEAKAADVGDGHYNGRHGRHSTQQPFGAAAAAAAAEANVLHAQCDIAP